MDEVYSALQRPSDPSRPMTPARKIGAKGALLVLGTLLIVVFTAISLSNTTEDIAETGSAATESDDLLPAPG